MGLSVRLSADDVERIARRVAELLRPELRPSATSADRWLTTAEAAEHLGLTLHALRHLVARRAIPYSQERPGARQFFKRTDLDRWRDEHGHDPML